MPDSLGIVAGGGPFPRLIAEACRAVGRPFFVLAIEGQTETATVAGLPHGWARFGAGERVLALLREAEVREVVFAGRIRRPSLLDLRPDRRAAAFLARIGLRALGDDSLIRAIVGEFEGEGFRVIGPERVLHGILAEEGVWTEAAPDELAWADIGRGLAVARALGAADAGQASVVQQGIVLAIEAAEGTDAMLARSAGQRRDGPGGVLVKVPKPQQERRVDLPTIGPETVAGAAAAGLRGIAVEAGAAFAVDRDELVRRANRLGLFIVGVGPGV